MQNIKNRRDFLKQSVMAGAILTLPKSLQGIDQSKSSYAVKPLAIASRNGMLATAKAMELLKAGSDTLDAVIAGVNIVEDDPEDTSVGFGGLPNEEGIVELDASVMHGPSARGGAVASLRNIKNPSRVARLVMERSDHVLIVGDGALRFAKAHGFIEENLLTDKAREEWLIWKENMSTTDDWLPSHDYRERQVSSMFEPFYRNTGTINCLAINEKGEISGVTTTSGLAFKIPGRVGDSPILGAGLYVDNEVGAAGSTGRGEANLLSCSSVMIVEYMRQGKSPEEACLMACKRIVRQTREGRLLDEKNRPNFSVQFYALNRKGEHGCAAIWKRGARYAVNNGEKSELMDGAYLFE